MRSLKNVFLLSILALCLLACSSDKRQKYSVNFNTVEELYTFLKWSPERYPLLSAHRGGPMEGFPENCIETFENARAYQPLIIEFDVSMTKDSVLVLMHDERLERTTNGKGLVQESNFEDIQKLRLKDNMGNLTNFKVPTYEETLKWAKGKVLMTIDVKNSVPYERIIEGVRAAGVEAYSIIITYTANQAAKVHRLAPELMISASVQKKAELKRLNDMGVPNSRIVAFVGVSAPEKKFYQYLHAQGITTILGTMGNIDESAKASPVRNIYYHLINNGADVLSTRNLKQAAENIDKYRYNKKIKSTHILLQ